MSFTRRQFLLSTVGAAGGFILPSFYARALEFVDQFEVIPVGTALAGLRPQMAVWPFVAILPSRALIGDHSGDFLSIKTGSDHV